MHANGQGMRWVVQAPFGLGAQPWQALHHLTQHVQTNPSSPTTCETPPAAPQPALTPHVVGLLRHLQAVRVQRARLVQLALVLGHHLHLDRAAGTEGHEQAALEPVFPRTATGCLNQLGRQVR